MISYGEWITRNQHACRFDSSCRKCKARLEANPNFKDAFARLPMLVTSYICRCGHTNDLTRRGGWEDYRAEWIANHTSSCS